MASYLERFNTPQSGKQVWCVQICPEHEKTLSAFSSLLEPNCSNCVYTESVKKEDSVIGDNYCRYPNKIADET